jgi:hypothetical protein
MNIETAQFNAADLVSAVGFIAIINALPKLHQLWNEAYPHDPMTFTEGSEIMFNCVHKLVGLDLHSEDDVSLVLELLGKDLPDLVQVVTHHLEQYPH